jgi:beta-N-acetylhexosaminidase
MESHVLSPGAAGPARAGLLLLPLLLLLAPLPLSAETRAAQPSFWESKPEAELVEELLADMSDDELLGQVFMLGYIGEDPPPELLHWIEQRNLGGVKIFTRNVNTLEGIAGSIATMQRTAQKNRLGIPLFISTDQEGGWVRHIKLQTSETPGNLALGAEGLPGDALLTGYYIGQELKSLGINMNFAPTIDVYSNPEASVIGPRAFSSDPRATSMLALAYFRGMSHSGLICTAKHYPGHGDAEGDSHGALPQVDISLDELWVNALVPYRILIPEGLPAIMTAHLAYPRILGSLLPSSRSTFFIQQLLRQRLGFQGVLITDDMEMSGALSGGVDTPEASLQALQAGNDVILVSHSPPVQEQTWHKLRSHLAEDPAFRASIVSSVRRVLRLKLRTFRDEGFPLYPQERFTPSAAARDFFEQSAMRSVTLLADAGLPLGPHAGERTLLVGQFEEFLQEGKLRFPDADTLLFPYSPFFSALPEYLQSIPARAAGYDLVVYCLANYNSQEILKRLRGLQERLVVVSTLSPVYLRETPWVRSALAVYGTSRESFRAAFAALLGDFRPEGQVPVDFLPPQRDR